MNTHNDFNVTQLVASDGYILTNGIVYGKIVNLSCLDDISNWYEITIEDYEDLLSEDEKDISNI